MSISDEDIQKVREASDIVSVFADRLPLKQRGRTFWCCCPFHDEKTPSLQIDPANQLWYCFGCHEGGDVFSYVMKTEDIDFPDAVRKLADRANIELHETGKQGPSRSYKMRLKELCKEAALFFHNQLMRGKSEEAAAAREYLSKRNFGGDVPKRWSLGFAPTDRHALMRHLSSKGYSQKEMIDANVAVSYEGRPAQDRFFGRVMFPICDDIGDVIAFGGRVVGQGEPKYLNSTDTPLYHKSNVLFGLDRAKAAMTNTGMAVVVEGYTDVIACHEAGICNVVATLGTALTPAHVRILSRHAKDRIVYLFDGDQAGQRAADRALQFVDESMTPEAGKTRLEICACTLPDDLDPADFIESRGADELNAQLGEAQPLIAYGINRRISAYDTSTPEGRTAAFSDAIAVLAPIKQSLLAREYAVQIAARLHMREDDAVNALSRLQVQRYSDTTSSAPTQTPDVSAASAQEQPVRLPESEVSRRRYEREFLGLCSRDPALILHYADVLAQVNWHVSLHAGIADRMLSFLAANPDASAADIAGGITRESPRAAEVFCAAVSEGFDAADYARFLAEELTLGDAEAAVDEYKQQLRNPEGMSPEEYDLMFQMVATMQKENARLRAGHKHP